MIHLSRFKDRLIELCNKRRVPSSFEMKVSKTRYRTVIVVPGKWVIRAKGITLRASGVKVLNQHLRILVNQTKTKSKIMGEI